MISTKEVLSKFSKELQNEYDELEKKIDQYLIKYDGNIIYIDCLPSVRVKEEIIRDYQSNGWKVSYLSDQRDDSGLNFQIQNQVNYYDDFNK